MGLDSRKPSSGLANNKGADQPAHPRSLISATVIRSFASIKSKLCCTLRYFPSSFASILMGKRELVALLSLFSWCLVIVEWLFLAVPWVCLQFVIVVFPNHTILFTTNDISISKLVSVGKQACLCMAYSPTPKKGFSNVESKLYICEVIIQMDSTNTFNNELTTYFKDKILKTRDILCFVVYNLRHLCNKKPIVYII